MTPFRRYQGYDLPSRLTVSPLRVITTYSCNSISNSLGGSWVRRTATLRRPDYAVQPLAPTSFYNFGSPQTLEPSGQHLRATEKHFTAHAVGIQSRHFFSCRTTNERAQSLQSFSVAPKMSNNDYSPPQTASKRLYVGNLPYQAQSNDVKLIFVDAGFQTLVSESSLFALLTLPVQRAD